MLLARLGFRPGRQEGRKKERKEGLMGNWLEIIWPLDEGKNKSDCSSAATALDRERERDSRETEERENEQESESRRRIKKE